MIAEVQLPIGPSLQVMLHLCDTITDVSTAAVTAAWHRWIGPHRFERRLAQFERHGWIAPHAPTPNTERVIRLTAAGRLAALGGRDPESRWRRSWDGRWRIVLFDVPEKDRTTRIRFQRRLRKLHFGYLQHSVWISPDSVDDLLSAATGDTVDVETLSFLEARPSRGETDAELVRGAWDFARINRQYEQYLKILASAPTLNTMGRARAKWLQVEWTAWCCAVRSDPLLPAALLPADYRGREALHLRMERMRNLLGAG